MQERDKRLNDIKSESEDFAVATGNETTPDVSPTPSRKRTPLRLLFKIVMIIIGVIILLPTLIYVPPIQTMLKQLACQIASDATGMQISVERFRLKFPLDIALEDVVVVETTGDTMVKAKEAIVDLRLRPLFNLDISPEELSLKGAMYRMVLPDSSMLLKAEIDMLRVGSSSHVNLGSNLIDLDEAKIDGGRISLSMDLWKKKPTPEDTISAKWLIRAGRMELENVVFTMSMRPTIDTLEVVMGKTILENGVIDLNSNRISAGCLGTEKGEMIYLTPTSEYIASHVLPKDTATVESKPMVIVADSVALTDYRVRYAMRGVTPQKGFDASYIEADSVMLAMSDFSLNGTDIRVPIRSIKARERCGLNLLSGDGELSISDHGIRIDEFRLQTDYSRLCVDADVSYSLMSMEKRAPVDVEIRGSVGFGDVFNFMPSLRSGLEGIPTHNPLTVNVKAKGDLSDVVLEKMDLVVRDYMSLSARGEVKNVLDINQIGGAIELDGELHNTSLVNRIVYDSGVRVPALSITGSVVADRGVYEADLDLTTEQGDVVLDGRLVYAAEEYSADVAIDSLQLQNIMPALGIGMVSAKINAEGDGFNPAKETSWTNVDLNLYEIEYGKHNYGEIDAKVSLKDGDYRVEMVSYDPFADIDFNARGRLASRQYDVDARLNVNHLDLQELGFSETVNSGAFVADLSGRVDVDEKLYDADLRISSVEWSVPDRFIHLPDGLSLRFDSDREHVNLAMAAPNVKGTFDSPLGLDSLANRVTLASDTLLRKIEQRALTLDAVRKYVPAFDLSLMASGRGMVGQMLSLAGVSVDSVDVELSKAEKISLNGMVSRLDIGEIMLDTLTLSMKDRGKVIDYRLHMGNRKGNLDEFSKVDLNGYLGGNRASASLTQRNVKGEVGYRLGLTTALQDSTVSLHFTPLNAMVAYMPWKLNEDNHVDYHLPTGQIDANLEASSDGSHIRLNTVVDEDGNALEVNIANLHIEDFLSLYALAPPIKGTINSDMKLKFREDMIGGRGNLDVVGLAYDRHRIGDFDFEFSAGTGSKGKSGARVSLLVDKQKVLTGYGLVNTADSIGTGDTRMGLRLDGFPLRIANAFLGKDVASLKGALNGDMTLTGSMTRPTLNGNISFKDASVYLPIMGSSLRMDTVPVRVDNNVVLFDAFDVWGANDNPLTLSGKVDASDLTDVGIDLQMNAREMQFINNDKRAKSDIYGKLFMTLSATARGSLSVLDINADASILPATDVYYTIANVQSMVMEQNSAEVVRFVQFSDTTKSVVTDSVASSMAMRINANLSIVNGAKATVNLSANGADRVQVSPHGTLVYTQSYMGDMRLNGQLNLGSGMVRYTPPLMGEKLFTIQPESYILWNGELMNPILNIKAINKMKASVKQDGQNSRIVNFDITLDVTNTLSNMGLKFDVSTEDDATVQNELKSMSEDQRSNQAMNMLITNAYTGGAAKSASDIGETALYSFLTSQLNSWAASNIRGVDLSFGIDQYDKTVDGRNSSSMSYSYQLSKSLFDNKFKIVIGGNYTTDASADENFAQNLISDISFEYTLKQTNTLSMYLKLFRHTGYESILEGEITETGAGFVMKRRLLSLKHLFRTQGKKKGAEADSLKDMERIKQKKVVMTPDSILGDEMPQTEGYDELN